MRKVFKKNLLYINIMSSRSLAAARAKRAGENAPPVSGNRPGTSIGSYAQQMSPGYNSQMAQPPTNVRISRGPPQQQQIPNSQQNAYQQIQQSQQQVQNSLPFSKLSISDAIGLITLRLGRVEQWVIENDNEEKSQDLSEQSNIPQNSKIVDNSVFSSIINRLELVEKKENGNIDKEEITKLAEEVNKFTEQLTRIGDEGIKHNLAIAKHTEQLFRFERELIETKDILKTFMIKYDIFASDTESKFSDYEIALSELEKSIQPSTENVIESEKLEEQEGTHLNDIGFNENTIIMSVDLKNIIKQELANT